MTFGRTEQCTVRVHSDKLSRVQAKYLPYARSGGRLTYRNGTWVLLDGDGLKHSTNGTWMFVERAFKLHDLTLFKAGNVLFKALLPAPKLI